MPQDPSFHDTVTSLSGESILISLGETIALPRYGLQGLTTTDWMESLKLSTGPVPSPWLWVLSSMTHQTGVTAVQSRRWWFSAEGPIHICQIPHCLFSRFTFYSLKGFLAFPPIPLLLWTKFVSDAFNQRTPRDELAPSEITHFLLGAQDGSASVCPPAHLPQKTP